MVHDAVRELHRLAHAAMSNPDAWPAGRDKTASIWQMLADSGLTGAETTHGSVRHTVSLTPEIELLLVCIGAYGTWDIPWVLEEHGFASEGEALEVWEAESEIEALRLLRLLLLKAYTKRFVRSVLRH
jgi:hypothetical protein